MMAKVNIFSYGKMSQLIEKQIEKVKLPAEFKIFDILLEPSFRLTSEMKDANVFLSSGYNATVLQQQTDIPVITIEPGTADILLAVNEAIQYDASPLIMTFEKYNLDLRLLKNLLKVHLSQDTYADFTDLKKKVKACKLKGIKCLIGSSLVCDLATEEGLNSVLVYPEKTVADHLQTATNLSLSIRREVEKNKQLTAVMDSSEQGVLLADGEGNIILCNRKAEALIDKREAELKGKSLESIFPNIEINDVMTSKEVERNRIHHTGNRQLVLNIIPIHYEGEISNFLLNFNDVIEIQTTEYKIRRSLVKKGFTAKHTFDDLASKSDCFSTLIENAKKFAKSDDCITIIGETGCGKEVLAHSIHHYSRRAENAFVAVNCSAISENLLESELFGYEEGAFTGAKKGGKEGLFEMAHQGTIFLDEIGDISPSLQAKLLRVIQNKEIMRVGGSKIIPINARIICATNKNLRQLTHEGHFREDLYYRINVLELSIPPLRDRKEDIYPLFLKFFTSYTNLKPLVFKEYVNELEDILCAYAWPGNIRELENCVKKTAVTMEFCSSVKDIVDLIAGDIDQRKAQENLYRNPETESSMESIQQQIKTIDRQMILETLVRTKGNQTETAKILGISQTTLWRRLKHLDN